ncbi:substrate-binding domain-containing protein [Rhizobium sp. BR 315]|uniref:substrate-binding domain-containing protein n=1 Tax=Rhizobium sp. BR 315 TaxID=3040014 RepID=UPI003D3582AC
MSTVLVNRREDELRASSIVTDDLAGMFLAVEHLIELGHHRIGHLAGPVDFSTGVLRRKGFEEAMRTAGLAADALWLPPNIASRPAAPRLLA